MKQKDIALIIVVIFISAVLSFVLSGQIFVSQKDRQQEVEVIQPITADFPKPDKRFFNETAFDPTKLITIGENANPDPFSDSGSQ